MLFKLFEYVFQPFSNVIDNPAEIVRVLELILFSAVISVATISFEVKGFDVAPRVKLGERKIDINPTRIYRTILLSLEISLKLELKHSANDISYL